MYVMRCFMVVVVVVVDDDGAFVGFAINSLFVPCLTRQAMSTYTSGSTHAHAASPDLPP